MARKYSDRGLLVLGAATGVIANISTRIAPVLLCNSSKIGLAESFANLRKNLYDEQVPTLAAGVNGPV